MPEPKWGVFAPIYVQKKDLDQLPYTIIITMAIKGKASELTAFSPGAEASKAKVYANTRNQALERLHAGMKKKEVGKRMQGKVGIITGVGPAIGIGVSYRFRVVIRS
jgi:hypothetical protein